MSERTFVIESRYCGPPNSANGGYAAGRLAAWIDGAAEVTLHRPPPLDKPLEVRQRGERVELADGDALLATAAPAVISIGALPAPDIATAAAASGRTFAAERHRLPTCFVCGPLRDHGDGLRIHVGPLDSGDTDWNGMLAAPWVPADNLADEHGTLRPEFVWAVLDCPTAYACGSPAGFPPILLGRQAVQIERLPRAGEQCVVVTQFRGQERRKHFAEAMLYGNGGERLASGRAIWIEVSDDVLTGATAVAP